jgi:N6-L-threonylcarbamoyladenine synthase
MISYDQSRNFARGKAPLKPVLGLETSCDETAAAVIAGDGRILSDVVFSQLGEHRRFGGVVPEVAARAHLRYLPEIVSLVMDRAVIDFGQLGAIAATGGPGLIGGLLVGTQFAKGLALTESLPFIAINHLEAHALTVRIPGLAGGSTSFPYLLFLLSGGHSQCVVVTGVGRYDLLGSTVDDAAGEAFDKVAKLLGLDWPGGPALERLAADGDPTRFPLPRPMLGRAGCDLSFSGLKTAVAQTISRLGATRLTKTDAADIAASFQQAVIDVLADRARNAMAIMREWYPRARLMVVAGGVASNQRVRSALALIADASGFAMVAPPIHLCTDNAVMVAWAGLERMRSGEADDFAFAARPRWPLAAIDTRPSHL